MTNSDSSGQTVHKLQAI